MAKILIVDDRPTNRQVLLTVLRHDGHSFLEAADGAAALALVRTHRPDLVITDILMPNMDGFEFAQRVRGDASIAATPIIFYTATYRAPEARSMAAVCRVRTVLPKPCDAHVLLTAVREELGLSGKLPQVAAQPQKLGGLDQKLTRYSDELQTLSTDLSNLIAQLPISEADKEEISAVRARLSANFVALHRFSARLTALVETTLDVAPDQGTAHAAWFLFEAACKIMECSCGAIGVLEPSGGKLEHVFARGFDPSLYHNPAALAARLPSSLLERRGADQLYCETSEQSIPGLPPGHPPVHDFIGSPVLSREWLYGWVYFADRADGRRFSDEDRRIAATIAAAVGVLLENAVLYDLLQRHAAELQVEVLRRKEAEEAIRRSERQLNQAQKMEAVGQLTGGVAHDFNNLLTVIQANAEDLKDELKDSPFLAKQAAMILQAASRGADLVRQLLAFARKQHLTPQVVELASRVESFAGLAQRALQENIAIEVRNRARGIKINVDAGSLETALLNLAINSRDAMPTGGKLIVEIDRVDLEPQVADDGTPIEAGAYARLAVKDTGMGMDKETAARAFEPFFTTKDVGKGTGLGLSMVYGFVKQSGGHARLQSAPGKGTTVSLYLPIAEDAPAAAAPSAQQSVRNGSASILLVEDDELVRQSVESKLVRMGHRVTSVPTADDAITALERISTYDLVFTDVIMPGTMTGADLAREVMKRWPSIRILATSGYAESTLSGKVEIPAGLMLLAKPYSNADLARAIGDAIHPPGVDAAM